MTARPDTLRIALAGCGLSLLAFASTGAQSPVGDPRWEPWVGCWRSTVQETATARQVCVTPIGTASAVEVATIGVTGVLARDTIDASGERRAISAQGCTGWERGEWSRDARRVYLHSELTCSSGLSRATSGMIAMSNAGEWLDIRGTRIGENAAVTSTQFRDPGFWDDRLPPEFVPMAERTGKYVSRALAGSRVGTNDVIDAVKHVDATVVVEWLTDREQEFDLDGRTLVALSKAGVPGSVTDVMIAMSFPERFAVATGTTLAGGAPVTPRSGVANGPGYPAACTGFEPMYRSRYTYDPCASRYGYRDYGYYDAYGYGYGGYGYDPYGYNLGGTIWYGAPVVVARGENEPPHGKVVNGRGYTKPRNGSGVEPSGQGASQSGREASSSGRSSGSSSSGRSSSGSSSSGSSSSPPPRTAQARPPKPPGH